MVQVLKDEIFERIYNAAIDVFYEKDYRSAKMQEIAKKAGIPVGLIYSYYKNKEELFDKIASSLVINFDKITREEEKSCGTPSQKYKNIAENYFLNILENHKIFVILTDKSYGTKYANTKENFIRSIECHIKRQLKKKNHKLYNDMLCHILAGNFTESILEVARHYKNKNFAKNMLSLVTKCYYEGVNSLYKD